MTAVSGSGIQGGLSVLTATLQTTNSDGLPVPLVGQAVSFSLEENGTATPVGTATTNADGIASLGGVSLAGFNAGMFSGASKRPSPATPPRRPAMPAAP